MAYKQPLGVADNKSYKDQYHFRNITNPSSKSDLPSLEGEPTINTTIKKNPYKSNVEIEGGETVLNPDLSALFKAVGKKHKSGGMDVLLKPNSFIFSDDKSLAFTPAEKKLFEFKEGGKYNPLKNTPSEIVKKNVPIKHYNTLINNIKDIEKDPLAKKSSAMMLEKYIDTLGNVGYLQEAKKGFPDGLPDFSRGTAPVYNPNVKQEIMESKQYAKYGGRVNPYMALGGDPEANKCPCGGKYPNCTPCTPEQLQAIKAKAATGTLDQVKGMDKIGSLDNTDYYHSGADPYGVKTKPGMTNQQWLDYLKTESPDRKAKRLASYKNVPGNDKFLSITNEPSGPSNIPYPSWKWGMPEDKLTPNGVTGDKQGPVNANWEFTPWQKISQAYGWGQYATAKRYDPFRSHYNATYAEPSLLNPEQAIGDVKGAANQQLSSLNTLSPILRNAQASSIYGQLLNTTPGIHSQYDNQNAGITNQFRQYNNQIKNNETMTNLGFDQQYYQQSVEGRKNFDNLRSALSNQAMDETNMQVEENQALAYNLLTRPQSIYDFNWKKGNFTRKPGVDIRDIYNASAEGSLDAITKYAKTLKDQGFAPQEISALLRSSTLTKLAPYLGDTPTFGEMMGKHKKGGKVKKSYRGY